MLDYLSIVRAVYSGLSQREVAKTHQVSRNTVALLLRQAKSLGWLTQEISKMLILQPFLEFSAKSVAPHEMRHSSCQTTTMFMQSSQNRM